VARVRFRDYDGCNVTVFGKGEKVGYLPIVDQQLRLEPEREILDRSPIPDEFLLYPERSDPSSTAALWAS
jgi:hypothetical protein